MITSGALQQRVKGLRFHAKPQFNRTSPTAEIGDPAGAKGSVETTNSAGLQSQIDMPPRGQSDALAHAPNAYIRVRHRQRRRRPSQGTGDAAFEPARLGESEVLECLWRQASRASRFHHVTSPTTGGFSDVAS
jgi:hypothetical protein